MHCAPRAGCAWRTHELLNRASGLLGNETDAPREARIEPRGLLRLKNNSLEAHAPRLLFFATRTFGRRAPQIAATCLDRSWFDLIGAGEYGWLEPAT